MNLYVTALVLSLFLLTSSAHASFLELNTASRMTCNEYSPVKMRWVIGPGGKKTQVRDYSSVQTPSALNGSVRFAAARTYNLGQEDICELRTGSASRSSDAIKQSKDDRHIAINSRGDLVVSMEGRTSKANPRKPLTVVTSCQYRILPSGEHQVALLDSRFSGDGKVIDASGLIWDFDEHSEGLENNTDNGCRYRYEKQGNINNHCGLTIAGCENRVVLEWPAQTLGVNDEYKRSNPKEKVTVRHPSGRTCQLQNDQVLTYQSLLGINPRTNKPYEVCTKTRTDNCMVKSVYDKVIKNQHDDMPKNKSKDEIHAVLTAQCQHDSNGNSLDWSFLRNIPGQQSYEHQSVTSATIK